MSLTSSSSSSSSIILLEASFDVLTITWNPIPDVKLYELQMKEINEIEWKTLSKTLTSNLVKKKNCVPNKEYLFRVCNAEDNENFILSEPFSVLDPMFNHIMEPPEMKSNDGYSITICWKEMENSNGYKIRYRSDDDNGVWHYIDSIIKGSSVRKKGLISGKNYYFSVIPIGLNNYYYSLSSLIMNVCILNQFFQKIFPNELLMKKSITNNEIINVKSNAVLAGNLIGVYISAHWCGPCRSFTPQLATFYQQIKSSGRNFEIIFCSADHSEEEFTNYYTTSHPWLAVPFDASQREELMELFKVKGIPRFVILSKTGKIVVDNAVGTPLSIKTFDTWTSQADIYDNKKDTPKVDSCCGGSGNGHDHSHSHSHDHNH